MTPEFSEACIEVVQGALADAGVDDRTAFRVAPGVVAALENGPLREESLQWSVVETVHETRILCRDERDARDTARGADLPDEVFAEFRFVGPWQRAQIRPGVR